MASARLNPEEKEHSIQTILQTAENAYQRVTRPIPAVRQLFPSLFELFLFVLAIVSPRLSQKQNKKISNLFYYLNMLVQK